MLDLLTQNPYFGLVLSLLFFILFSKLSARFHTPLLNPLLFTIIAIILVLSLFDIPLQHYQIGGDVIQTLISPVQALVIGVSLYKQKDNLVKYLLPIFVSVTVGCIFVVLCMVFLGNALAIPEEVVLASIPKSITTAIAMEISGKMGWIVSITVMFVILTGIFGAVIAPYCLKLAKIKHPVSKGLGIGTAAHAVGTSYAMKLGEVEGAMSGLTIGLHAIIASVVMPLLIHLLGL